MIHSQRLLSKQSKWILALITAAFALSLIHALGAAVATANLLRHHTRTVEQPFSLEFAAPVLRDLSPAATRAGLSHGDVVLWVNDRPLQSMVQFRDLLRTTEKGQQFRIAYVRPNAPTPRWQAVEYSHLPVRIASVPAVAEAPLTSFLVVRALFFFLVPLICLFIGLYVIAAKPSSLEAWCAFVVLAFPNCIFTGVIVMPAALLAPALFWNHLVQAMLPMAVLMFGVTFPERSAIDRRAPWLKWTLIAPLLALVPYDFLATFADWYNFRLFPWLIAHFMLQAEIGNTLAFLCVIYFFVALLIRYRNSSGDVRRRLTVLVVGAILGLGGFFVFVGAAVFTGKSLNALLPAWTFLLLLSMLLVFPVSLAYVVIVQRASDLRILIRQGTKYFFAKQSVYAVRIALTYWLVWQLTKFSLHPERRRIADLAPVALAILLFAGYRLRFASKLQEWIDRRFFRDAYSSEQLLSELSDEARTFREIGPLLTTVTNRIAATLHVDRIAVYLLASDHYRLELETGSALSQEDVIPTVLPMPSSALSKLSNGAKPLRVTGDDPQGWFAGTTESEQAALHVLSIDLLVPLPGRSQVLGIIALGPKRSEEPYSRTDRQLLQSVATQTGLALENAELLQSLTAEIAQRERVSTEIAIAHNVQQRLFPQTYPSIAGVDMAGSCRPAQAVGGDYYDLFALANDDGGHAHRLGVAIGDISGKGISASLLMASLRAGLRILAPVDEKSGDRDLTWLIHRLNRLVFESSDENRYATFFLAEFEPATRQLTYVNAGHNPPVVFRKGEAIPLAPTGPVVGLLEDAGYEQGKILLKTGDVLLAYTDGISEAMNIAEEEWGEESMLGVLKRLTHAPGCTHSAQSLVQCLFREADQFTSGAPQHDDMTAVVCVIQ